MLITNNILFFFIVILILSFFLVKTPIIGKFLRVINTLFHETGHALMALLFNKEVYKIELFQDTSGSTIIKGGNKISNFFIALAGYPFASIVSFLFLYFLSLELYTIILYFILFISIINITFWVRNIYGILWIILFSIISILIIYKTNDFVISIYTMSISSIMIIENLIANYNLLKISYKNPTSAGDATLLKNSTYIPSLFWAILFFSISLLFVYLSLRLFI